MHSCRTEATPLPESVSDHCRDVHDHVCRAHTARLYVHVHARWQSAPSQQTGADDIADEQHQEDILVRVLRATGTAVQPPPLEANAAGAPHHRRTAVLVLHRVLAYRNGFFFTFYNLLLFVEVFTDLS